MVNTFLWRTMHKISIIGSGNVATHLAKHLFQNGISIHQVYSRTLGNALILSKEVDAQPITDLNDLNVNAVDLIILTVKDDALEEVANYISVGDVTIVHTSGAVGLEVLHKHLNHGVLYPLQTFSKNQEIDLSQTPFCIEANNETVLNQVNTLASTLSNDVREVNSESRKAIHIAAVFACNFSNHMLAIADKILKESKHDLSIVKPLVDETIHKAFSIGPKKSQTGPASRNDEEVMEKHWKELSGKPGFQEIYKNISESIIKMKNE